MFSSQKKGSVKKAAVSSTRSLSERSVQVRRKALTDMVDVCRFSVDAYGNFQSLALLRARLLHIDLAGMVSAF